METLVNNGVNQTLQNDTQQQVQGLDQSKLDFLNQMMAKQQAEAEQAELNLRVQQMKSEYEADPAKKAILEAGLKDVLDINPRIVNDQEGLSKALSLYTERATAALQAQNQPVAQQQAPVAELGSQGIAAVSEPQAERDHLKDPSLLLDWNYLAEAKGSGKIDEATALTMMLYKKK